MTPLTLAPFPGYEAAGRQLATALGARLCGIDMHRFPDGETALRFEIPPAGEMALLCPLDRPNEKFLPLVFAAHTARELGARRVGLIAPYLGYMRQDTRFEKSGAISARLFAGELSRAFDWIVTVDPHLHRIHGLADVFSIEAAAVSAAPALAGWIGTNVERPFIIGPDDESRQWVERVAGICGAPYAVLEKRRLADDRVVISAEHLEMDNCTPVLIDDVISTAHTMAEAAALVGRRSVARPWCVAVHAVFADRALEILQAAAPQGIVTTNTIPHPTNRIDVTGVIAAEIVRVLQREAP